MLADHSEVSWLITGRYPYRLATLSPNRGVEVPST